MTGRRVGGNGGRVSPLGCEADDGGDAVGPQRRLVIRRVGPVQPRSVRAVPAPRRLSNRARGPGRAGLPFRVADEGPPAVVRSGCLERAFPVGPAA